MKTIILKTGFWLLLTSVFVFLLILLNLNVVNQVDEMISRQQFEEFLNKKLNDFAQKQLVNNSDEPRADSPDQAALQDYLNTVDPVSKTVPKERLKEAYTHTRAFEENPHYKSTKSLQWQATVSNFGGRTRAIMWDPNDPYERKVWAGGVTGGLWYKENITNTVSWVPVNDFWPGLAISCMTHDPNSPETFYVGTGEAQTALIIYRESSGVGFGIMRSTDAGENWEVMPGTEDFEYVTDIVVRDEGGSSVIYAAVASGIYKGAQHLSQPSDGLFRSVVGSDIWEQVLPNITDLDVPYAPADIELGPDGRMYVGSMPNVEGEGGATILYSDEATPGTWTVNDEYKILIENTPGFDLPGRVVFAAAPSDPNRVYALVAQGYFYGLPGYECHIIARSDDKGETWNMVSIPPPASTGNWAYIAWHAMAAGVDPNNPDRIFIGALDMWVSDNAGDSWSKESSWVGSGQNFVHADQHTILFKEGNSNEVLIASDGGVFHTVNASQNSIYFMEKNYGFNTLQMYKVALHPTPGVTLFLGGMQDNGTIYYDGLPIEHANTISGGDGGACFFDDNEPDVLITSSQNNRFNFIANGAYAGSATQWSSGNFISSVDYDYNLNTLYANAVTTINNLQDNVLRIAEIPYGPYEGEYLDMGTGSTVPFTHVKYSDHSPTTSSTLLLGTQAGRLFRVENAEASPDVTEIGPPEFPTAAISCIAEGNSADTLLVTFSNFGVSSVWQSWDGGLNWEEKEGDLPDMPVRWALYHPDNANAAMLATEIGIWTSYNLDEPTPAWQPDNEGLANVRIDMLQLRKADKMVMAGSHGRGFYYTTFDYNPPVAVAETHSAEINIYPNPVSDIVEIQLSGVESDYSNLELINSNGKIVLAESINRIQDTRKLDLSELSQGSYILKITDGNQIITKKIIKL